MTPKEIAEDLIRRFDAPVMDKTNYRVQAMLSMIEEAITAAVENARREWMRMFSDGSECKAAVEEECAPLRRENETLRELLRQSRHLYGRNSKESVEIFEQWRRRVEAALTASDR